MQALKIVSSNMRHEERPLSHRLLSTSLQFPQSLHQLSCVRQAQHNIRFRNPNLQGIHLQYWEPVGGQNMIGELRRENIHALRALISCFPSSEIA